jgi:hypothetical protein
MDRGEDETCARLKGKWIYLHCLGFNRRHDRFSAGGAA